MTLVVTITMGLGTGCAARVDFDFDAQEDFSRYRTWDWLPGKGVGVDAPHRRVRALDERLVAEIEEAMSARGFVRSTRGPDFYVTSHLELRRVEVDVKVPLAPYLLSSNGSGPSYWIGGTVVERRSMEDLRLVIGFVDRGRVTWHAALSERLDQHFTETPALALDDALAALLESFPRHETGASRPKPQRAPLGRPAPAGLADGAEETAGTGSSG